jgi:GTP-binding protein
MKFLDEIELSVEAGHGGAGSVHFLHEKYREFGGPDGGDGGRGGDVYIEANSGMQSLGHFLYMQSYHAGDGEPGRGKNKTGKDGEDLIIQVPLGTQIVDPLHLEILGDLIRPGMRILVAVGGKGGLGNQHFANSVNQAPRYAQPGLPGEKRRLHLNLKLIADVGLIGLPNAGKSTLLAAVSRSHPKIADYAFTTLVPNLGVVESRDHRRFILADIPGIIEGASRGAGLGLSFLRHIERVKVMLYVIDVNSIDPIAELQMLRSELGSYSEALLCRPSFVILNKMDTIDYDDAFAGDVIRSLSDPALWQDSPEPRFYPVSAREHEGLNDLIHTLFELFENEVTLAEEMLPGGNAQNE